MSKVQLDPQLQSKLNGLSEVLELCDGEGHTKGFFVPTQVYQALQAAWMKNLVSDQEIAELEKQTGGRTLKEIWKSVGRQ